MNKENFNLIQNKIKDLSFSQKAYELATSDKLKLAISIKVINLILVASVLVALFLQIFNPNEKIYLYIGVVITIIEIIFLIFQLSFNPEKEIQKYKKISDSLLNIKNKYSLLLADLKNNLYDDKTASKKIAELNDELDKINKNAPPLINKNIFKVSMILSYENRNKSNI